MVKVKDKEMNYFNLLEVLLDLAEAVTPRETNLD
jgi:hypothetical protein